MNQGWEYPTVFNVPKRKGVVQNETSPKGSLMLVLPVCFLTFVSRSHNYRNTAIAAILSGLLG